MIFNYIILYGDTHGAKVVRLQRNAGVSQTKATRDLYEWRSFLKSIMQSYKNYLVLELQLKSLPREGTERFASSFLQTSFWKHARGLACARGTYSVAPALKKPSARMRSEGYSQSVSPSAVSPSAVSPLLDISFHEPSIAPQTLPRIQRLIKVEIYVGFSLKLLRSGVTA